MSSFIDTQAVESEHSEGELSGELLLGGSVELTDRDDAQPARKKQRKHVSSDEEEEEEDDERQIAKEMEGFVVSGDEEEEGEDKASESTLCQWVHRIYPHQSPPRPTTTRILRTIAIW